jgi:DNA-binding NarL/FixJ family response regulator
MNTTKKRNLLFIKDTSSKFDASTKQFDLLFNKVDIAQSRDEALIQLDSNDYDVVLSDLSEAPNELAFLKQIQSKKPKQTIFVLMSPKHTDKLYAVSDLGVHAFELTPEQFDLALEEIAKFELNV